MKMKMIIKVVLHLYYNNNNNNKNRNNYINSAQFRREKAAFLRKN
jgi:hypothetical protein